MDRRHIDGDGILRFTYPSGKMCIVLASFFPAGSGRLRKLLGIIGLNWSERAQICRELLDYLESRYDWDGSEKALQEYANAVVDFRTKAKEIGEPIEKQAEKVRRMEDFIRTLPRGKARKPYKEQLTAEKEALKDLKEKQRDYKSSASFNNGCFISRRASAKKYATDIEILRETLSGWN